MRVTVFTSITLNYMPKAQVLARSLKQHHPEFRFCLALAEPADPGLIGYEPAFDEVLSLDQLPIQDSVAWTFEHSVVEICTAIKGQVMQLLLERPDVDAVIYIDPDIAVFNRLEPVLDSLSRGDIVLTPHLCEPEQSAGAIMDNEICALKHGIYNLGFLAVAARPEGRRFAAWWRDRLDQFCFADFERGLFTDQRWMDLAPAFFPTCQILRHPGCNVATWNLSRRRVEGDFRAGFTANGQPLVFYHFSGFDSGAQLTMLRRYAADMPAAFRLRHWYVEETARVDDRGYHRRRWRYACYDNGEPITTAQRRVYREQPELRRRFPNPFATGANTFLAWCGTQAGLGPAAAPPVEPTPLERYLGELALHVCPPHPWFEAGYYLLRSPDVRAHGVNPLWHYLIYGEAEGRAPHHDFDPVFIRGDQPGQRAQKGGELLAFELRGRTGRVHPRFSPRLDQATLDRLRSLLRPQLPAILHVGHEGRGGTSLHVEKIIGLLESRANGILLAAAPPERMLLQLPTVKDAPQLVFDRWSPLAQLKQVLQALNVQRIHVHHWLYSEDWLSGFLNAMQLPYDITLHDYYFLSPQPHLLDSKSRFVGDENLDCDELTRPYWHMLPRTGMHQWRDAGLKLLYGAQRIIAPSQDIANRHLRIRPELKIRVAPHPETPRPETIPATPRRCAADEPLRVVLLGHACRHKGRIVLQLCARIAKARRLPIEFHILGKPDRAVTDRITVHGLYEPEELQEKLRSIRPHIAWFPAQCPESYCYTLSEAMEAGLPILASALGSLPERLSGRAWSWTFPWNSTPEAWLEKMLQLREQYFVQGAPATGTGTPPRWDTDFYAAHYLDWAQE